MADLKVFFLFVLLMLLQTYSVFWKKYHLGSIKYHFCSCSWKRTDFIREKHVLLSGLKENHVVSTPVLTVAQRLHFLQRFGSIKQKMCCCTTGVLFYTLFGMTGFINDSSALK
jgi:hypothetical protein